MSQAKDEAGAKDAVGAKDTAGAKDAAGGRKSPAVSRREWLVLGGLAGLGLGAGFLIRRYAPLGAELGATPVVRAALAHPAPQAGNPAGSLTLALFTDYNCPACRMAHPAMLEAVAADGDVRLKFLDWPVLGSASRAAARGALAAHRQGLYRQVHMRLMGGARADGPAAEAALAAAGGDVARLRTDLASQSTAIDLELDQIAFHAFAIGARGTPAHLIGTLLVQGALDARAFRRAFDRARSI